MVAHRPKRAGFQLETNEEQHHYDAELGEMLQLDRFGADEA